MRERNIARPAGGFGGRRRAVAVPARVAFLAAAVCCALTWAPVSSAGVAAASAAVPSADNAVSGAGQPANASAAGLPSDRVDLPLPGIRTVAVSLDTAPDDGGSGQPAGAATSPSTPPDDGDGPTATALRGQYAASITAIDPKAATVTFDVVEWFTGSAAQQACAEDGVPRPWQAEQCNDYYVRNKNVVPRTLPVAPTAKLLYVGENGPTAEVSLDNPTGGDVPTTLPALAAKLTEYGPSIPLKCFLGVESGTVTEIDEIFTP